MQAPIDVLDSLIGHYTGESKLWLDPTTPPFECTSEAAIRRVAGGFFAVELSWSFKGNPEDGLLLYSYDPALKRVRCIYVDSWHMNSQFMDCTGEPTPRGDVVVVGTYKGDGQEWRWRTEIIPDVAGFRLKAINVAPDGREALAVEAPYRRK
jgi:hypothetical protein